VQRRFYQPIDTERRLSPPPATGQDIKSLCFVKYFPLRSVWRRQTYRDVGIGSPYT
jgi:hypothetical protein